jgi:isocitrate dehydrogenase (NAD+)
MVMPYLYGDIVSDLCAGLIGGLGLTAYGNIGFDCEIYEAVHGTVPDITNQNKVNPTALVLSTIMMLKSMKLNSYAKKIETSVFKVMRERKHMTVDLGGKAKTTEYTQAIIHKLED